MSADRRKLRHIAETLVESYGHNSLNDRERIRTYLDMAGLLTPADDSDEREDRESVDFVESHARWLLS